jgi:hypothetical protein
MARNEYETRQLVFLPKNRDGGVTLEVSAGDLAGPRGAVIPAADIELRLVEEIDIAGTTQFPGDKLTGLWPDPLVPNAPFTLEDGRLQCVWLTVKTAATTAPGEYQGRLAIKQSGGGEVSLPVTVTVRDFVLPEKSSLKSLFGAWSHNWAAFYRYAKLEFGAWLTPPDFDSIPKERQLDAIRFFARYRATLQGMNTWGLMFGKVVPPVLQPDGSMSLTEALMTKWPSRPCRTTARSRSRKSAATPSCMKARTPKTPRSSRGPPNTCRWSSATRRRKGGKDRFTATCGTNRT